MKWGGNTLVIKNIRIFANEYILFPEAYKILNEKHRNFIYIK